MIIYNNNTDDNTATVLIMILLIQCYSHFYQKDMYPIYVSQLFTSYLLVSYLSILVALALLFIYVSQLFYPLLLYVPQLFSAQEYQPNCSPGTPLHALPRSMPPRRTYGAIDAIPLVPIAVLLTAVSCQRFQKHRCGTSPAMYYFSSTENHAICRTNKCVMAALTIIPAATLYQQYRHVYQLPYNAYKHQANYQRLSPFPIKPTNTMHRSHPVTCQL